MSEARRRFTVTAPDWGQDHLSTDAVVAFVDDELARGPHERALAHLSGCAECSAHVVTQRQARSALRTASCPALPSALLSSLRSIPQDTELPGPPAGLAMSADGQMVSVLRPETVPTTTTTATRRGRRRLSAGAAVSGIALGALALGVSTLPGDTRTPVPTADRGVLGGPVLGGSPLGVGHLDARFGFGTGGRAVADVRVVGHAGRDPMLFLRQGR